ncbi:unnamed protein product [Ambrosiozyma monospora]|uniref:Unnamed protein product n=1 Tax=Ambrosiozyma monospora TaxID=43982 RepID=A0A9W6Z2W0_AMBMO|nr:unnamed protein product [Ambrosiozyma monospora]
MLKLGKRPSNRYTKQIIKPFLRFVGGTPINFALNDSKKISLNKRLSVQDILNIPNQDTTHDPSDFSKIILEKERQMLLSLGQCNQEENSFYNSRFNKPAAVMDGTFDSQRDNGLRYSEIPKLPRNLTLKMLEQYVESLVFSLYNPTNRKVASNMMKSIIFEPKATMFLSKRIYNSMLFWVVAYDQSNLKYIIDKASLVDGMDTMSLNLIIFGGIFSFDLDKFGKLNHTSKWINYAKDNNISIDKRTLRLVYMILKNVESRKMFLDLIDHSDIRRLDFILKPSFDDSRWLEHKNILQSVDFNNSDKEKPIPLPSIIATCLELDHKGTIEFLNEQTRRGHKFNERIVDVLIDYFLSHQDPIKACAVLEALKKGFFKYHDKYPQRAHDFISNYCLDHFTINRVEFDKYHTDMDMTFVFQYLRNYGTMNKEAIEKELLISNNGKLTLDKSNSHLQKMMKANGLRSLLI